MWTPPAKRKSLSCERLITFVNRVTQRIGYTSPWAIMAPATFRNPAMFAPTT